jgi:lysophospholipase L1-like esterase
VVFSVFLTLLLLAVAEVGARVALGLIGPPEASERVTFKQQSVWKHGHEPQHETDPELLWKLRAGFSSGGLRVNSLGCRGDEIDRPKPGGRFRILVLGDSVTFGFNVDEHEAYVSVLEALLTDELAAGGRPRPSSLDVVNGGVLAYTSWQSRLWAERLIPEVDPDLVVVMVGYNDHHSAQVTDRERSSRAGLRLATLGQGTGVARLARRLSGDVPPELRVEPRARVSVPHFRENLLAIGALAERAGARALFVTEAIRTTKPLVENFWPATRGGETIWLRQMDFIGWIAPTEWKHEVIEYGLRWGEIDDLVSDDGACAKIEKVTRRHPRVALFHQILGECHRHRGEDALAAQAEATWRELDVERAAVNAYFDEARRMAREGEIELLDVADVFAGREREMLMDPIHPTPSGHAVLAERIAARVRPLVLEAGRR